MDFDEFQRAAEDVAQAAEGALDVAALALGLRVRSEPLLRSAKPTSKRVRDDSVQSSATLAGRLGVSLIDEDGGSTVPHRVAA